MFKKHWQERFSETGYSSTGSSTPHCSDIDCDYSSNPRNESIAALAELEQEHVSSVLQKLESIQQLAGDAKVLRRKETREHNSRRMHIAQFFSLLLEEAEFNPQAVRQRNVVALLEGIKQQHSEVYFFSVEEARMKLAFGPSVKLRDAVARPHRYAERLLVDMEVLDRMLTELSTQQILDILNKGSEYLTYMQTTYQVKAVEEKDSFSIKNASGLAVYQQSVFVADAASHCIWRLSVNNFTAQGNHEVELYAGVLRLPGLDDGPLHEARFRSPAGIVVSEKTKKIYVADSDNHSIRELDMEMQVVTTIRIALSPTTTEILGACFIQPKGLCLIHGDCAIYREMEACQVKKAEEYKEHNRAVQLMQARTISSSSETSSTSESGQSESSLSELTHSSSSHPPEVSTLSSSHSSASSSSSSSSDSSSTYHRKQPVKKTKAPPKNTQRGIGGNSLEQSLSSQWMRNYTVLMHETGLPSTRAQRRGWSPMPPRGNPPAPGSWRFSNVRRRSTSESVGQVSKDDSLPEVRLAVTCDHCVWYVDPHSGRAHVIAGHPSQYGYCDQHLGLAARFSSPKGLINIRSVLFVADYWNNVIRTVNLYSTKVDTVVDFNPQGPVAISLSEFGVVYVMDSDCIHYSNMLRIMSVPCDGDGNSISSPTIHEDKFCYQSYFSQPRTRSSSITSESTRITKTSEVWDAYRNKSTEVWLDTTGKMRPVALAPPAERDSGAFASSDLRSRLEEHLHKTAAEEQEKQARSKERRDKMASRRKKKKREKKRARKERNSGDDPMYIDPRLLQGSAPRIRISTTLPDEPPIVRALVQDREDKKDREVLQEDDEGEAVDDESELQEGEQEGADPLAQALKEQLQHLEDEEIDPKEMAEKDSPDNSRENTRKSLMEGPGLGGSELEAVEYTRKSLMDGPGGNRKSSLLLPDDAKKRPKSPKFSRPRSPGIIDTDDHVERTKIQLHTMGPVSSRRGSFQDTPMTLSDLGITERKGSMSVSGDGMRRGSWKGTQTTTSLAAPVKETGSDHAGATSAFLYQHYNWNNGEYRMMPWGAEGQGVEAASADPEAGTVMVSGGKAFYRTEGSWSISKSPCVSQNVSRNSSRQVSRRASRVAPAEIKQAILGEDEEGNLVDFVTARLALNDSRRPSRRDSNATEMEQMDGRTESGHWQASNTSSSQITASRNASNERCDPQSDTQQKVDPQLDMQQRVAAALDSEKRRRGSLLEPNALVDQGGSSRRGSLMVDQGASSRRGSCLLTVDHVSSRRGSGLLTVDHASSRRGSIVDQGARRDSLQVVPTGSRRGSISTGEASETRSSLRGILIRSSTTPVGNEKTTAKRASLEIPAARRNSMGGMHSPAILSPANSRRGSLLEFKSPANSRRGSLAFKSPTNSRRGSLCGLPNGPPSVTEDRRASLLGSRKGSRSGSLSLEGPELVHRRSIIDRRGSMGLNIMPTVLDHGDEKEEDGESNDSDDKDEDKKSSDSNKSSQNSEVSQQKSGKAAGKAAGKTEDSGSPSLQSLSDAVKGPGSDVSCRDLKRDSIKSDVGSDEETKIWTTDPSPLTVSLSPETRAPTAELFRDEMSPTDSEKNVVRTIFSLAKVPFTRDLDVDHIEEALLKGEIAQTPASVSLATDQGIPSVDSIMNRRISNISSSAIGGTYKITHAPVSKVWRPVTLPEPLSSAHRTKRKYPNTPLSLAWYQNDGENFLFIGLFSYPTLLKIIPPKHHEPDKAGRFNVLPIDSQRVLLADESSHQIWLFNHQQHVLKHLAGCGKRGHIDGPLETCRMSAPCALTLDPRSHYIYVADRGNHVIRKIDLMSGLMSTAVGNGFRGNTDGHDRLRQCLDSPFDVSFSEPHYLIISCADNAVRSFNLKTHYLKTILVGS